MGLLLASPRGRGTARRSRRQAAGPPDTRSGTAMVVTQSGPVRRGAAIAPGREGSGFPFAGDRQGFRPRAGKIAAEGERHKAWGRHEARGIRHEGEGAGNRQQGAGRKRQSAAGTLSPPSRSREGPGEGLPLSTGGVVRRSHTWRTPPLPLPIADCLLPLRRARIVNTARWDASCGSISAISPPPVAAARRRPSAGGWRRSGSFAAARAPGPRRAPQLRRAISSSVGGFPSRPATRPRARRRGGAGSTRPSAPLGHALGLPRRLRVTVRPSRRPSAGPQPGRTRRRTKCT